MAETDLADWLLVMDAAAVIGCSKRTVERLARARTLESRLRRQDGTPPVAVYNPDDCARLASERRPAPAPFVLPAGSDAHGNGAGRSGDLAKLHFENATSGDDPIRQLFAAALRAVLSPPSPPVAESVAETSFVTIPEASAITGLTQAYLKRAIEAGTLKAIRDVGWRIRRRDLEAL